MTQQTAFNILKTGTNVFLTGEPGSGKTYLINKYIKYLRSHGINVAITASTGIAATHISGTTIHSWAGIGIHKSMTNRELQHLVNNERLSKKIRGTQVLFIDEISMLESSRLDLVERVCRTLRGRREPFGGLQVVLVGDFFQLPPIHRTGEEPPGFAFTATAWTDSLFAVCYLTEQHRQSDPALSSVLAGIRGGVLEEHAIAHLTSRKVANYDSATTMTKLYSHNTDVDQMNAEKLAQLPGESRTFTMDTKGAKAKIEQLIRGCLSPDHLELKIGAAVICTRNNPELGFVNGTLGTVVDFDSDEGYPIIKTQTGRTIVVPPAEWNMEEGEKVTAVITQIPLRLAWAITVHKSQGMSLDAAVMDLSRAFTYGQGYVALSRVRTLDGLFLLGWNQRALMIDPEIQAQDSVLREQSVATELAWQSKPEADQKKKLDDFIRLSGGKVKSHTQKQSESKKDGMPSSQSYGERLERIRQRYPKTYTPWTEEEDLNLKEMYDRETSVKKLADKFSRQPGAIRSRLKKIGLTG